MMRAGKSEGLHNTNGRIFLCVQVKAKDYTTEMDVSFHVFIAVRKYHGQQFVI